jgi:putative ABC transport system permease protein
MKLNIYLAVKYIIGNKKRTIFLIMTIAITLMTTIAISIVMENGLNQQETTARIKNGNWHLTFRLDKPNNISLVRDNKLTKNASIVRRLKPIEIGMDSFDFYMLEGNHMDIMVSNLTGGKLPIKQNEIIVPDWYLRKNNIEKLPKKMSSRDKEFIITGSYKADVNSLSSQNVKGFMSIENNQDYFADESFHMSPLDEVIMNDNNYSNGKYFVFVELKKNISINDAIKEYLKIDGVCLFDINDNSAQIKNKPIMNSDLIIAEARDGVDFVQSKQNLINDNISVFITIFLQFVLFVTIFTSMNLIVNNNIKLLGVFSALGLSPKRIMYFILIQIVLISFIAIAIGTILGLFGTFTFLSLSIGKLNGQIQLPVANIIFCVIFCFISTIIAASFPAKKASRISPVNAINTIQGINQDETNIHFLNLKCSKNKVAFSVLYGIKNAIKNSKRLLSIMFIIIALLSIFTKLTSSIELEWKTGSWRTSYLPDYEISAKNSDIGEDFQFKPVDKTYLEKIKNIDGIKDIYYQYSISDNAITKPEGYYDYYFKLPDNILTEQAKKQLEISGPIKREGYETESFVMAGISGYTEKELNYAMQNLIEGTIDIDKMKKEPIILLPKYITWFENMDIPYTNLKIGDKVTIVENKSDSVLDIDIKNEYVFTVGGFVDKLPFSQYNGSSNGFVAIMHSDQLKNLQTKYKGITNVYITKKEEADISNVIESQIKETDYDFINNVNDFDYTERETAKKLMLFAFYSLFTVLGFVIFFAIFNLVLSNIFMRKTEFLMLYAIGMLKWQRTVSLIIEILAITIPGVLVGSGIGILLIIMQDNSDEVLTTFQIIPWIHLGIGNFIVLSASIISAVIGIIYINKNCSVENMRHE